MGNVDCCDRYSLPTRLSFFFQYCLTYIYLYSFPTRRSSDLAVEVIDAVDDGFAFGRERGDHQRHRGAQIGRHHRRALDRKSTRLNSSHVEISYAVFCLKKKTRLNSSHVRTSYTVFCLKKTTD